MLLYFIVHIVEYSKISVGLNMDDWSLA